MYVYYEPTPETRKTHHGSNSHALFDHVLGGDRLHWIRGIPWPYGHLDSRILEV